MNPARNKSWNAAAPELFPGIIPALPPRRSLVTAAPSTPRLANRARCNAMQPIASFFAPFLRCIHFNRDSFVGPCPPVPRDRAQPGATVCASGSSREYAHHRIGSNFPHLRASDIHEATSIPVPFCLLPSALCLLPSALCPLPSALCPLPSALCPLPSALCPLPSALCPLPSALCPLPSALCPLPSALCHSITIPNIRRTIHSIVCKKFRKFSSMA